MLELVNKFIGGAIIAVAVTSIIYKVLEKKTSILSFKTIVMLILLSSSTVLFYKITYDFTITLLTFTMAVYVYSQIFNISIDKTILATFMAVVLLCMAEIILALFIVLILRIDIVALRDAGGVIFIIINILVGIVGVNLLNIKKIAILMKDIILLVNTKRKTILMFFCLLELIVIGLLLHNIGLNFKFTYNLIINAFLIIFFLFIFFMLFIEKIRYQKLTNEYTDLVNYVGIIEDLMEKDRIRNHESKNKFIVIKDMVSNKNKKLLNYINNILDESIVVESDLINKLKNIPKGGLQGLIYYKLSQMKSNKIDLFLDISKNLKSNYFSKLDVRDYQNLCTIMGVYLDNAIEAASVSTERQISIEMYLENKVVKVVISNTFNGLVSIEKIGEKGYSTKGKGRGYGLALVNTIIDKNDNFSQNMEIINNYYVQHLNIKIN